MEKQFRGMDANGVMRYGRMVQDKPHSTTYYEEYSQRICWDDSNIPVSNKSLAQFIGRNDSQSTKIYEGDLIQTEEILWLVEPIGSTERDGRYYGLCVSNKGDGNNYFIDESILAGVVVGNIYENPELLEEV